MIYFLLIFLFFKIDGFGNLMYAFSAFFYPIILLGLNVLIDLNSFSLDRINYYLRPVIILFFILDNITDTLGVF